ncbi:MAG: ABC transporter ATP-binding protein/permease [Clostridium sp.]|nr:ABC transporter ATP-binding protein/permease [Clostridium sp.]MCM1399852.1 ABC transporter ATP-binding protein/permease [Clostridium sp.]
MKELMKYFKNYKIKAVLAPLFKMLEASFELLVPLVMANIIDIGIKNNNTPYIYKMALLMIGLGIIGLVCSITAQYFSAKTAMGFGKELRRDLFQHIETLSYTEIDEIGSSTLITRMTSDVNQIQTGVNMFLRLFMRSPFIVFGATIMAFTVDAHVARVFLVTLPVLIVIVFGIMMITIPLYRKVQARLDQVLLSTRENLSGVRVIRAFNQEENEKTLFCERTEGLTKEQIFVGKISSFLNPLTYAVINLSIVAIIWKGAGRVADGFILQGSVYALVNYMSQILVELVKLANLIVTETKAVASANRVSQVLLTNSSQVYPDAVGADKEGSKSGKHAENVKVQFVNAGLTYKNAKEPSIEGVNLIVKKGDTIGIIGGTGSGKSTFVNLIPRFYDCTEGQVLIDGIDVKEYPKETLIDKIGIVPQKAVLFSGTIEDNMRWGKADASNEEINLALDIAQAKDFVQEKEGGIKFMLNQGAKNLSGGQKQRLTIARALVKKPEILILDDSSSALDYATDAALRMSIKEKTDNMTVFIVSQRSSSIMYADKIVVLDDGCVVGIGTHEELLQSCEVYQEICSSQNKAKDEEQKEQVNITVKGGVMA